MHIALHRKLKFLNALLYKTSNLVIKKCFCYVRYDAKFKKQCEDRDVIINKCCLQFDIYSKFKKVSPSKDVMLLARRGV